MKNSDRQEEGGWLLVRMMVQSFFARLMMFHRSFLDLESSPVLGSSM